MLSCEQVKELIAGWAGCTSAEFACGYEEEREIDRQLDEVLAWIDAHVIPSEAPATR